MSSRTLRNSRKPSGDAKRSRPLTEPAGDWAEPDWSILDDRRGDLPEFPIDVSTPPWQVLLRRASKGAGVLVDHVALPLFGIASSLIGTARRIRASSSWSVPTTLWSAVVAASGDGKTPGLNVSRRVLDRIEKDNTDAIKTLQIGHATCRQRAKEARQQWERQRKEALKAEPPREPPQYPLEAIDPGDFIYPRLYATDPSVASLSPLVEARPRGVMLVRDELSGLFANMVRSGGEDRAFWLESWDGARHIVERLNRSVDIPHLLVGVVGGFQPDKVARAFQGDEDGMYARFLFGFPSTPEYRPLSNEANEVESELYCVLKTLIQLPSEDAPECLSIRTCSREVRRVSAIHQGEQAPMGRA